MKYSAICLNLDFNSSIQEFNCLSNWTNVKHYKLISEFNCLSNLTNAEHYKLIYTILTPSFIPRRLYKLFWKCSVLFMVSFYWAACLQYFVILFPIYNNKWVHYGTKMKTIYDDNTSLFCRKTDLCCRLPLDGRKFSKW